MQDSHQGETREEGGALRVHSGVRNRLRWYLEEIQDYWFHGPQRRLARETGIPETTISRILRQACTPRYEHICRIVAVLEKKMGRKIDPREIFLP